jgi:hypothetical protein
MRSLYRPAGCPITTVRLHDADILGGAAAVPLGYRFRQLAHSQDELTSAFHTPLVSVS